MRRLIDADELNVIKEKLRVFDSFISTMTRQCTDEHIAMYEHWIDCRYDIENTIDNLPTAYDIEKVVEELEKKRIEVQKMKNDCIALSDMEVCDIENITYDRAKDIVRKGGVG